MIAHDVPPPPVANPELLLEYLRVLEPRAGERRAVRIAAGRLKPLGHLPEHRRSASQGLAALAHAGTGELFLLSNDELLFFYPADQVAAVNGELSRLASFFSDRFSAKGGGSIDHCITRLDCRSDFAELVRLAKMQLPDGGESPAQPRRDRGETATAGRHDAPLTLDTLVRLETALAGADLSALINRHSVCRFDSAVLKPSFTELTVSISGLATAVVPGLNLTSNIWLFDVLTETLDRRMLSMLVRPEEMSAFSSISLNLNVATLLSDEFLAFDAAMSTARRGNLVIELKDKDVFHDLPAYLIVRDLLQHKGYRFCLDGVGWRTLDLIDGVKLGFDFVKVNVDQAVDESGEHLGARLAWMVKRVGAQRFILSRVEAPQMLTMGRDAGVALFQGQLIEKMLTVQRCRR
ncbi:MAG: EAL domain-containing protein [Rhodospirillales bacterium]|nr:EAL domain-containing protein [Rhodospirillales bacterium]